MASLSTIVDAIKLIYENSSAQVITPDGETDFFDITAGIFQGDTLAPFLFLIVLDYALKCAFKICDSKSGIVIKPKFGSRHPEIRIRDLCYADDAALLNNTLQLAENLLHCVESSAALVGLYLNVKKTKFLTSHITDPYVPGEDLQKVDEFLY